MILDGIWLPSFSWNSNLLEAYFLGSLSGPLGFHHLLEAYLRGTRRMPMEPVEAFLGWPLDSPFGMALFNGGADWGQGWTMKYDWISRLGQ